MISTLVKSIYRKPGVLLPILLLLLVFLSAIFAGLLSGQDPLEQNIGERLEPPSKGHIFGTDGFGRDVFCRVLYGSRVSLSIGLLSLIVASAAGVAVGLVSAYVGGKLDLVLQRVIDIMLGFPFLVLAIMIVIIFDPSPSSVAVSIALALMPKIARLSRSAALLIIQEEYILAARMSGAKTGPVIIRHVLPNSLPAILAQITGYLGLAVGAEATLSFLGLGVPPPYPSWGGLLLEGTRQYLEAAPWVTLFPGIVLGVTVMSFAILGDALQHLIDVRKR